MCYAGYGFATGMHRRANVQGTYSVAVLKERRRHEEETKGELQGDV
jgi:hypothetical protein